MNNSFLKYFKSIFGGLLNLILGMRISILNFFRPKITEQYPENRKIQVMFERFRGKLAMPHNSNNEHRCTACGICQMNCPNGTIVINTRQEIVDAESGKMRKVLDRYIYNLGSCIFCDLCVQTCPQDAIEWSQEFEHSTFTRGKLIEQLNHEGSKLAEKKKVLKEE